MAVAFAAWLLNVLTSWTADGLASLREDVTAWARLNECAYRALRAAVRQEVPNAPEDDIDHTARALADILWGQQSPLIVNEDVESSYLARFGRAIAERFAVLDEIALDGTDTTQAQAMHLDTERVSSNFLAYFIWALEDASVKSSAIRPLWQVLAEGRDEQGHLLTHRYLEQLGQVSSEILRRLQTHAALDPLPQSRSADPKPGEIYFAQPVPEFRARFGREDESADLSIWLGSGNPLYLLHGQGGIGKTTLVLDWLHSNSVRQSELESIFYWAFDHENSFQSFLDHLSEHLRLDASPRQAASQEWLDQPLALVRALSSRRILLVLDGFERQCVAYDSLRSGSEQGTQPPENLDALRRIIVPDTSRFLRYFCAPSCRTKTLVVSRLVPYELLGDLGQIDGCVISRLEGLSTGAADQLLNHFTSQLRRKEREDIVKWADCNPQLLRLIGSMIARGRISSADICSEKSAQALILTHADGQRDAVEDLVRRLPPTQRDILACAAAIGRSLSAGDMILLRRVLDDIAAGTFTDTSCLESIREMLALEVPPELYTYDSGGSQRNTSDRGPTSEPPPRISRFGIGPTTDATEAQFATLAEFGLVDTTGNGYSIHPVVQAVALKFLHQPVLSHLVIAHHLAVGQSATGIGDNHDIGVLIEIYAHLVEAWKLDIAADLLFLRIVRPLFFGSARFYDLRMLTRALLPSPEAETTIADPGKQAHIQGFFARMQSKTGGSLAAVQAWNEHISLRMGMGDTNNAAAGLGYLSQDQVLLGDLSGAVNSLNEAIEITREVIYGQGHRNDSLVVIQLAMHLTFLAGALAKAGQINAARRANREALQLWQQLSPHYIGMANCALNDGELAVFAQHVPTIERAAQEALRNSDLGRYERGRILGLRLRAVAALMAGQPGEGRRLLEDALAGCRSTRFMEVEPDLLLQLSWSALRLGDYTGAQGLVDEALELANELRYRPNVADACLVKAHLLTGSAPDQAMSWCEEALSTSFSPDWRSFVVEDRWLPTWWDACRGNGANTGNDVVNKEWRWKSGYKAAMDSGLALWLRLRVYC